MPNSEELQIAFDVDDEEGVRQDALFESVKERVAEKLSGPDEFDELAAEIHPTNVEKGFWGEPVLMDKWVAKLALIHSEVTEILEALRKNQGADAVTEEFSDVLIRVFDLHGELVEHGEATPGLYQTTRAKMEKNKNRPPKHGNRWG